MDGSVLVVNRLRKVFPGSFSWRNRKREPEVVAVENISFDVKAGEIVGLLGPNGAGKTTTIQMLLGTTSKSSGTIQYFGMDFDRYRSEALARMNYASAYTKLPWHLTVKENLMVYAKMYQVTGAEKRIKKLLSQFDMLEYLNEPVRELSAGQTTRVILAKAFLNYPELILLDEPTASLDPDSAATVREFLKRQRQEYQVAMLFTSHNMAEVSEVCDRVLFIQKGRLVAEDTPRGLAQKINEVHICLDEGLDTERLITCKEDEVARVLQSLKGYTQISIDRPTLEDYFVKMSREGK